MMFDFASFFREGFKITEMQLYIDKGCFFK